MAVSKPVWWWDLGAPTRPPRRRCAPSRLTISPRVSKRTTSPSSTWRPARCIGRGHIPGAWFAVRARLRDALARLPQDRDFVLTAPDGLLAQFAAPELQALTARAVLVLAGGTRRLDRERPPPGRFAAPGRQRHRRCLSPPL